MEIQKKEKYFILSYFSFSISMISFPIWPYINLFLFILFGVMFIFSNKIKIEKKYLLYILIPIIFSLIFGYFNALYMIKTIYLHRNINIEIIIPISILCFIVWLINVILFKNYKGKYISLLSIILSCIPIFIFFKYDYETDATIKQIEKDMKRIEYACYIYSLDNNKHFPQNLEILKNKNYISSIPNSPIQEKEYTYIIEFWDSTNFTILCPTEELKEIEDKKKIINKIYYSYKKGFVVEYK